MLIERLQIYVDILLYHTENPLEQLFLLKFDPQEILSVLFSSGDFLLQEFINCGKVAFDLIVVLFLLDNVRKPLGFDSRINSFLLFLKAIHLLVIQFLMQSFECLSKSLQVV